jgi:hypothetical protein
LQSFNHFGFRDLLLEQVVHSAREQCKRRNCAKKAGIKDIFHINNLEISKLPAMHFSLSVIFLLAVLAFGQERAELLGPVNVSKVNSLDEAKGKYKSPKKAMFMSLVLPGSGQFYVGNSQSRYVRGTFYLAEEIALISGLYYNSIYKYDKQVKKYQNFAKTKFSVTRYETAMGSIFRPEYEDSFKRLYGSEQENYCKAFYGSNAFNPCYENFGQSTSRPDDATPLYNASEYYQIIANENFILGWEDALLSPDVESNLQQENPKYKLLGTSGNYGEYLSLRKKATSYADRQAIFLGAIILNHIVSAIDAALSARAHNNSLYEEKVSFLDKIRLGSDLSMGEDLRVGAGLRYLF